jgi:nucleoside-diphosphate-sugar epimerase
VWRAEQEGLQTLVVNPSVLLGKASYEKSSGSIYQYVLKGSLFFPKGNINYIDIRDAAAITRLLVQKNVWGERFIVTKESIPYNQFFNKVGKAFGVKAPKIPLSNGLLRVILPILSFLQFFGLSKNPLNKQLARNSQLEIFYANRKVQSLLSYEYRDLSDTLEWAKLP